MDELRSRRVVTYTTEADYRLLRELANRDRTTVSQLTGKFLAERLAAEAARPGGGRPG